MPDPHLNGDDYDDDDSDGFTTLEEAFELLFESLESIDAKLDVIMSHFSVRIK